MKRIRIGKDIKIVWKILTNLKPLSLEEKDIRLVLTTPLGRKSDLPFHVSNDIVYSSYPGILQKETGVYKLTLWVNYGKPGQSVVDNSMAFKIVSSTCQEPEQDINPEETVTACGNLIVGVTGDSAYEIAVRNGFVGSEKEWLESLKGGTTSIIPSFKLKDNMELEATYPNSDNTDVERVVIGKVAVTPKGEYEEDEIYNILDIVGKDGCSYISKKSANTDPPENDESWLCIAKKGDSIKYEDLTPEQLEELQKPATKSAEALSDLGKRLKVLVWELEELEQISNLRDYVYSVNEDDIEIEDGYFTKKKIKFADRKYDPSTYSGKGYKILRKNIVEYTVKLEFEIESGCTNNGTITVSVNGISYDIEITSDSITPESVAQLISSSIPGSTLEGNVITFNGETSISFSTTGIKGKVTNRYISEKNVLTQDMINKTNTIYEIRYDFDLNEKEINIPEGCILKFEGGSINNGTLGGGFIRCNSINQEVFNSVSLKNNSVILFLYNNVYTFLGDDYTTTTFRDAIYYAFNNINNKTLVLPQNQTIIMYVSLRLDNKHNFIIDGNGSTLNMNKDFYIGNSSNFIIKNLNILNRGNDQDYPLWIQDGSNNFILDNVNWSGTYSNGKYYGGGIHIYSVGKSSDNRIHDFTVKNCNVKYSNVDGILIHSNCYNFTLENNTVHDCGAIGIEVEGRVGNYNNFTLTPCKNGRISNNCVYSCKDWGYLIIGGDNITMVNNIGVNNKGAGLILGSKYCNINSNILEGTAKGLEISSEYFDEKGSNTHINVLGNTIKATSRKRMLSKDIPFGIIHVSNSAFINVKNNNIVYYYTTEGNNGAGISIASSQQCNINNNSVNAYNLIYGILVFNDFKINILESGFEWSSELKNIKSLNITISNNYVIGPTKAIGTLTDIIGDYNEETNSNNINMLQVCNNFGKAEYIVYIGAAQSATNKFSILNNYGNGKIKTDDTTIFNDLYDRVDYYQIGDRVLDKSNNTSYFFSPVGWVDSLGNKKEIRYAGLFNEKPTEEDGIKKGFFYFCIDKQTTEGLTNGIMIYHKGNNVWVDALGREIS